MAGVTHTTVSRVIHNDSRITKATQDRVREAMKSSGYQPNLIARGLVRKKTQVVALITPDLAPHTLPIVRSVAENCTQHDYATMLFPTNTWLMEKLSIEWVSQNWMVDGILVYNLIYHEHIPDEILRLRSSKLPFVFINKFLNKTDLNAVGVDNDQAVALVIEHLVSLGHKRIGLLYGDDGSVDGMERHRAFLKAVKRFGIDYDPSISGCGMWRDTDAQKETARIITQPNRPTAIFCSNDMMAIGAMRAIKDAGLRVPEDIAVAGFDDLETSSYIDTPLTTIRPALLEVGAAAFDLLMRTIQDPNRSPEQIKLKSELIVRASTAS